MAAKCTTLVADLGCSSWAECTWEQALSAMHKNVLHSCLVLHLKQLIGLFRAANFNLLWIRLLSTAKFRTSSKTSTCRIADLTSPMRAWLCASSWLLWIFHPRRKQTWLRTPPQNTDRYRMIGQYVKKKKTKKMRILNSKVILTPNKPESWPVPDCCGRHIPRLDLLSDKAVLNTHQAATNKPCCYDMLWLIWPYCC